MNKIVGIIVVLIMIIVIGFIAFSRKNPIPQQSEEIRITPVTDIQATFAIYTNGTLRVFTAAMYHNRSEDVFIEASNPNVVKVKNPDITWNDFFLTLPLTLTTKCLITGTKQTFCTGDGGSLKFYINGEQSNNALNQKIRNSDKLLVTFGVESEEAIKQQLEY